MKLKEFLKNRSFLIEAPCRIRLTNKQDNSLGLWDTWEGSIPEKIYESSICWITSYATKDFPGCDSVIQIDVLEEETKQ